MAAARMNDAGEHKVHVGRQAIYDQSLELVGYELLFRSGPAESRATANGAHATSRVIVNTFTEFGLEQLTGSRLAFINLTREFLVGDLPLPFDPGHTVLEILETVEVDDEVMAGVRRLVGAGYAVALDDFVFSGGHDRLLELASYVKLEVLGVEPGLLAAQVAACREHKGLRLVAERLETVQDLDLARGLGFDLYQGYLLGRSQVLTVDTLTPSRIRHIQLVDHLARNDFDVDEVTSMVSSDPALALRVLRATNSAAYGLRQKVSTVRQALMLLGMNRLRHWLSLMLVSDMGDTDEESISLVLVQARFCQSLAEQAGLPGEPAFTVGLLAGLAELLRVRPGELISELALDDEVAEAVISQDGRLGSVLATAHGYVSGELSTTAGPAEDGAVLVSTYLSAVDWSMRLLGSVDDEGRSGEEA